MASSVEIANLALGMLGAGTITSLDENSKAARTVKVQFDLQRDSELRAHRWKFAIARATCVALASAPASGPYLLQFQLPTDFLKELDIGDAYPGMDLSDYRSSFPNSDYRVEGGLILTNLPSPLALRYIRQVTDCSKFDGCFVTALAAKIAWMSCESLTSSAQKRQLAIQEYNLAIKLAIRANALESPPEYPADAEWVMARIQ